MKALAVVLAILTLIVGIAIGGWQLNWWMASASTNRTAHIYRNSYGAQSAAVDALSQKIADINRMRADGTPRGVIQGYIDDACQTADSINQSTLDSVSPRISNFVYRECS